MKREFEEQFLDYIEKRLSVAELERFENALRSDEELARSFEAYRRVLRAESVLAKERFSLPAGFATEITRNISNSAGSKSLEFWQEIKGLFGSAPRLGGLATLAAAIVGIALFIEQGSVPIGMVPQKNISENTQFRESIAASAPESAPLRAAPQSAASDQAQDEMRDKTSEPKLNQRPRSLSALVGSTTEEEGTDTMLKSQSIESDKQVEQAASITSAPPASAAGAGFAKGVLQDRLVLKESQEKKEALQKSKKDSAPASVDNYALVSGYLLGNKLPPPELVRVDEFVKHFQTHELGQKPLEENLETENGARGSLPFISVATQFATILSRKVMLGDEVRELQRLEQQLLQRDKVNHAHAKSEFLILILKAKTLYENALNIQSPQGVN